jgi:hypothetical protein
MWVLAFGTGAGVRTALSTASRSGRPAKCPTSSLLLRAKSRCGSSAWRGYKGSGSLPPRHRASVDLSRQAHTLDYPVRRSEGHIGPPLLAEALTLAGLS